MERNIFEIAARQKLRIPSDVGMLSVEQLWDLRLSHATAPSLDGIYKRLNAELKSLEGDSLVETKADPRKAGLELAIDIVKHIFGVKQAEDTERKSAAARAAERNKLVAILGEKQDEELKNLTPSEIQARIAALGAGGGLPG
jgi:hypothetical protein